MSTLFLEREFNPFDILFRNLFDSGTFYEPAIEAKINYPVDIYENSEGLYFEVACVGLDKEEISIDIEGDILKISYEKKPSPETENHYIHKGIAKRSFNLGYKIASKFNLVKSEAKMDKGLLHIFIPLSEGSKPKSLTIK